MKRFTLGLALALAVGACSSGDPTALPTPSTSVPARISSTGSIQIISPKPGELVQGPDVKVRVKLTGAKLIKSNVAEVRPDIGHMHVSLGGETLTLLAGLSYTIKDLKPGQYIVTAEFVTGNHAPFSPRVLQTVGFRVK